MIFGKMMMAALPISPLLGMFAAEPPLAAGQEPAPRAPGCAGCGQKAGGRFPADPPLSPSKPVSRPPAAPEKE
jgi:hypothetical protein